MCVSFAIPIEVRKVVKGYARGKDVLREGAYNMEIKQHKRK